MRVALLKGGAVANIVRAADDMTPEQYADLIVPLLKTGYEAAQALRDDEACNAGDRLVNGKFEAPPADPREALRATRLDNALSKVRGKRIADLTAAETKHLLYLLCINAGMEVDP
jgi:hypothetical protein